MPECHDCHEPCWQCREDGETSDIENVTFDPEDQEGSVHSHESFSLVDHIDIIDADIESISSSGSVHVLNDDQSDYSPFGSYKGELSCPLSTIKTPPRSYVHTPNERLNVFLDVLMILSVTAVVGLGMGHFLGWSNQWWHHRALYRSQFGKLKGLQEELILCMQKQEGHALLGPDTKPCFEKAEYWQQRFTEVLSENEGIRTVLMNQEPGRKACSTDPQPPEALTEEMNQLRMDLLHKQLEHISTVKQYEDIKTKERESRQRMQTLQSEVEFLRARLQEEEREDEVERAQDEQDRRTINALEHEITALRTRLHEEELEDLQQDELDRQTIESLETENRLLKLRIEEEERAELEQDQRDRSTIRTLETERDELRTELDILKGGNQRSDNIETETILPQVGTFREQINTLQLENTDLRRVIARMRYTQPPTNPQQAEEILPIEPELESPVETKSPTLIDTESPTLTEPESPTLTEPESHTLTETESPVDALRKEMQDLRRLLLEEQEDAKRWRHLYEERLREQQSRRGLISWLSRVNFTQAEGTLDALGSSLHSPGKQGMDSVLGMVSVLQERQPTFSSIMGSIPSQVRQHIDTSSIALQALQENLQSKLAELQTLSEIGMPENVLQKLGKVIRKTMKRLEEFGRKAFPADESENFIGRGSANVALKYDKLNGKLDMKWAEVMNRVSDLKTGDSNQEIMYSLEEDISDMLIIPQTVDGEIQNNEPSIERIEEPIVKEKKDKGNKSKKDDKRKKGSDLENSKISGKAEKVKEKKKKLDKNVDANTLDSSEDNTITDGLMDKSEREKLKELKKDKKLAEGAVKEKKKNKDASSSKVDKKYKDGFVEKKKIKQKEKVNKMKSNKSKNSEEAEIREGIKTGKETPDWFMNRSRDRAEKRKKEDVGESESHDSKRSKKEWNSKQRQRKEGLRDNDPKTAECCAF